MHGADHKRRSRKRPAADMYVGRGAVVRVHHMPVVVRSDRAIRSQSGGLPDRAHSQANKHHSDREFEELGSAGRAAFRSRVTSVETAAR